MIPMADNVNHADTNVIFEMICKSMQLEAELNPGYFSKSKFMNDYSSIFARDGDKLRGDFDLINVNGRFNKESFELNKKEESWETLATEISTK